MEAKTNNKSTMELVRLKKHIEELYTIANQNDKTLTPISWTGSATDLVELAYGILETKRLNSGDVDIQIAINYLSEVFSFPIKDCYNTFRAIRMRTDSRTLFLDEMKEKLNQRMDDLDNGIFRKKRK